jgi:hypothetical protein
MPELLLFSWDHSTQSVPRPSVEQLAALPKRYDLITVQADGWQWGSEELANPWFRVLAWPDAIMAEAQALLSPQLSAVNSNVEPTTYWQYRGFYLDLQSELVPAAVQRWFADDTRAEPRFVLSSPGSVALATLKTARAAVAIPVVVPV